MAPHTKVKHEILKNYLHPWFNIMAGLARMSGHPIQYIDGFAGPGEYKTGEVGSPIVALDSLLNHQLKDQLLSGDVEYRFVFIEKNKNRVNLLREAIEEQFPARPPCVKIDIVQGDFEDEMLSHLTLSRGRLPPTFAFIDPFGYSLPISIMSEIMHNERCEIMVNYMSGFVNRFAGVDPKNDGKFDALFGTERWRDIRSIDEPAERRKFFLDLYKSQLRSLAGARYIRDFEMKNHHHQVCYDLVYATNNKTGMEQMKEAMWRVDPKGTYSFSDITNPCQATLVQFMEEKYWLPEAAELIGLRFQGQTVSVEDVQWYVVLETPYLFRKACLKKLEEEGRIQSVVKGDMTKRKKWTYPKGSTITFRS
jgi:three-Cys-motif partner protein